jgi:hypothetical protein
MPSALPAGDALAGQVAGLLAREAVIDTLTTLFVATDDRAWAAVRGVLAPEVHFDMTSLTGGEPGVLTREQIADGWAVGLAPIEHVHHQIGNVRVHVDGTDADASCYGIAYHHRRHPSGRNTRVFVGTYDFRLHEEGGRWRITSLRFTARFVDGNATLDRDV